MVNPFSRNTIYLRDFDDGSSDVHLQYEAGFRTFLLTVHGKYEYSFDQWEGIIKRIEALPNDAVWLPWAFLHDDADCWRLRGAALKAYERQKGKLRRPAGVWNAESALNPNKVGGATVHMGNLLASGDNCDGILVTEPWAFEGVNYSIIPASWYIEAELFPAEVQMSPAGPRDCLGRFHDTFNVRAHVRFMYGVHDCAVNDFPRLEPGRQSIYSAGDINPNYKRWIGQGLPPLTKEQFPYRGPLYGPVNLYGKHVSVSPEVVKLKKAMHNAGYAHFPFPDKVYNARLEKAMRAFQRDKNILPTGQYGLGSYEALRTLPSAIVGQTYAINI